MSHQSNQLKPNQACQFVSTSLAAEILGLSRRTLEKMRVQGRGPVYCKLGSRVSYSIEDLTAWANANRRHSTSDTGQSQPTPPLKPVA